MDLRPYPATIVFVRHAESVGNTLTREQRARTAMGSNYYQLTERGREQARLTGAWMRERFPSPDRIFRSYYARTRETAELLYPGTSIQEDPRLAEADRGIWHVRTEEQVRIEAPFELDRREFQGIYHYRPIGGENWPDIEIRLRIFRNMLRAHYSGKTVVVVGHGQWLLLWQKTVHRWTIDETVARYLRDDIVANASVLIYRGETDPDGRHRLVHDPATDYIVPWQSKLPEPTRPPELA